MTDLTIEQQKAIALAKARKQKADADAQKPKTVILPTFDIDPETGDWNWKHSQLTQDAWNVFMAPKRALDGDLQYGTDEWYETGAAGGAFLSGGAPTIANKAVQALPKLTRAQKGAHGVLEKSLKQDNITPGEAIKRMDELGPDGMLMDLGENTQALAEGVATNMGKPRAVTKEAIVQRNAPEAITQRVTDDLTNTLGRSQPAFSIIDDLVTKQREAAGPIYDSIRNVQIEVTPNIAWVMQTPLGKSAFNRAMKSAANEKGYVKGEGLTAGIVDLAKRELDDMVRVASRNGQTSNKARQARDLAKALTKAVDEVLPQYKAARETFAGPERVKDALNAGLKAFDNKVHPSQLQKQLDGMSVSEREAFLQGVQNKVFDLMGTARNDVLKVRNLLDNGFNREKLSMAIGREETEMLFKALDREATFKATQNRVMGGSHTASRQAARDYVNPQQPGGEASVTWLGVVNSVFKRAKSKLSGMRSSRRNEELAKLLTSNNVDPLMIERAKLLPKIADQSGLASAKVLGGTGQLTGRRPLNPE